MATITKIEIEGETKEEIIEELKKINFPIEYLDKAIEFIKSI